MDKEEIFSAKIAEEFEESIRLDRGEYEKGIRAKNHPVRTYYLTEESKRFLLDFFKRINGNLEKMRKGSNHWLYGYYGSGKSHLLSVLSFLADSKKLEDLKSKSELWEVLTNGENRQDDLRKEWKEATKNNYLIPISINLLKYQGSEDKSISELISKALHEKQGLSSRLEVAHFENWFKEKEDWERKDELANQIAEEKGLELEEDISWEQHVRKYEAVSKIILPEIFRRVTGSEDGYQDLTPDRLGPEKAVEQVEEWRNEVEKERGEDVKIILLLDEVSLFMGSDFDKVTELNSLAEKVDDIGQKNIQMVVTAQESVEEVHKDLASKGAAISIVKDRFPHRYSLPSKHASEIVRNRLLKKTEKGKEHVRKILDSATLNPATQFGYTEIGKDTSPSLNTIKESSFIDYYPALPYLTPLFMEILANMRESNANSSKSVFSGTTRAILAIVHGLLNKWEKNSKETEIINLVDFFDLIRYEIEEVAGREEDIIDDIEDNFGEDNKKSDLAKVIFLLNQVPDFIPSNDENIAIGIMNDLEGKTRNQMLGEVGKGLNELEQYIKEDGDENKRFRFTTRQERDIYKKKESKLKNSNWDEIIDSVDKKILKQALKNMNIPSKKKFSEKGEEFKIKYNFSTPEKELNTIFGDELGLEIPVTLEGLRPNENKPKAKRDEIVWKVQDEGKEEIRKRIKEWWALAESYGKERLSSYLEDELQKREKSAVDGLARMLKNSFYKVREKSFNSIGKAVEECVKQRYFDSFHPLMTKIDSQKLRELKPLEKDEKLPGWALTIQVPPNRDDVSLEDDKIKIMNSIRATVGKKLKKHGPLNIDTILDYLSEEEPLYEECKPAVLAILWGLSKNREEFLPIDESRDTKEYSSILETSKTHKISLKIDDTPTEKLSEVLQEEGFQDTTETKDQGIRNIRKESEKIEKRLGNLKSEIELLQDDIKTEKVNKFIQNAKEYLSEKINAIEGLKDRLGSDSPNYIDIAKQVRGKKDALERFSSDLEYRKKRLLQIDILVTLSKKKWTTNKTTSSADKIKEVIKDNKDLEWWLEKKWTNFTSQIGDYELKDNLEEDWSKFKNDKDLEDIKEFIKSSSIVDFDKGGPELQNNYIVPAKNFFNDLNKIEEGLKVILSESEEKESKILEAEKKIKSAKISEYKLKDLRNRIESLTSVAGSLSDAKIAGVWPRDRSILRKTLEKNLKKNEADVEKVEGGMIIK